MKILLKQDVHNVGRQGDIVSVSDGYARNFLFPKNLAQKATEKRLKEWAHLQKVATAKKRKSQLKQKEMLNKAQALSLSFEKSIKPNGDLFGSVSVTNIQKELALQGLEFSRKDIILEEPIKKIGEHTVKINAGDGLTTTISVQVKVSAESSQKEGSDDTQKTPDKKLDKE